MRLALGFFGQFAKATFSSLPFKKFEAGHHIRVRGFVVARWQSLRFVVLFIHLLHGAL